MCLRLKTNQITKKQNVLQYVRKPLVLKRVRASPPRHGLLIYPDTDEWPKCIPPKKYQNKTKIQKANLIRYQRNRMFYNMSENRASWNECALTRSVDLPLHGWITKVHITLLPPSPTKNKTKQKFNPESHKSNILYTIKCQETRTSLARTTGN